MLLLILTVNTLLTNKNGHTRFSYGYGCPLFRENVYAMKHVAFIHELISMTPEFESNREIPNNINQVLLLYHFSTNLTHQSDVSS